MPLKKFSKKEAKPKTPDYEKIGKLVYALGETGQVRKKELYRTAFFKGIVQGFGGVIGATVVVSLLLWLFTILDDAFLIGDFVSLIRDSIAQ